MSFFQLTDWPVAAAGTVHAMKELRFDVFGREIVVRSTAQGWQAVLPGGDGKSRPAGFPIPAELNEDEIIGYLDDLFHESASADYPKVRKV